MIRRSVALTLLAVLGSAVAIDRAVDAWQADAIVALERRALDRWIKADPGGFFDLYARDVTYFDPLRDKRVDGLAALTQLLEPVRGKVRADRYEMIAPQVIRSGTLALLTYNFVSYGRGPDGKPMVARWNSTTVYTQVDGRWKIAHSHWSLTRPELKVPPPL